MNAKSSIKGQETSKIERDTGIANRRDKIGIITVMMREAKQ